MLTRLEEMVNAAWEADTTVTPKSMRAAVMRLLEIESRILTENDSYSEYVARYHAAKYLRSILNEAKNEHAHQ